MIPDFQTLMLPLLKHIKDAREYAKKDIVEALSKTMGLTEEEKIEMLPSRNQPVFYNRVTWVIAHFKAAKIIENSEYPSFWPHRKATCSPIDLKIAGFNFILKISLIKLWCYCKKNVYLLLGINNQNNLPLRIIFLQGFGKHLVFIWNFIRPVYSLWDKWFKNKW